MKPKQKLFLGIPVAFISPAAFFGAVSGYFITRFLSGKESGEKGFSKSIIFNVGEWTVHLHHWLVGIGILISSVSFDFNFPHPYFSYGFLGGLIFQGIVDYPDWYRVFIRKR